jgi:hypothetical protein
MTRTERIHKYLREGTPRPLAEQCVDADIECLRGVRAEDYPVDESIVDFCLNCEAPLHRGETDCSDCGMEAVDGLAEGNETWPESEEGPATWEDLGYGPGHRPEDLSEWD